MLCNEASRRNRVEVKSNRNPTVLRLALAGVAALCIPLLLTTDLNSGGAEVDDATRAVLNEQFHRYLEEVGESPLVLSSGPAALVETGDEQAEAGELTGEGSLVTSSGPAQLAAESGVVPPGNYAFPRQQSDEASPPSEATEDYGRVLLYVTSHFSREHKAYLQYCWKNVLANSPLLRGADVAVYLNPNEPESRRSAMSLLADVFANNDLTVYLRPAGVIDGMNKDVDWALNVKRSGAVMAIYEAVAAGYFDGYDWVIRVNPDVLIREDLWFRRRMADPLNSALVINCNHKRNDNTMLRLHTDFFVVRPSLLREVDIPREVIGGGAEASFTAWIQDAVFERHPTKGWIGKSPPMHKFVRGAAPRGRTTCRAGHGKDFRVSPVVHEHALHPDMCRVPKKYQKVFVTRPWPKDWKPV